MTEVLLFVAGIGAGVGIAQVARAIREIEQNARMADILQAYHEIERKLR